MVITAFIFRKRRHILFLPCFVWRNNAGGNAYGVAVHTALVVTAEQAVHIELWEVIILLFLDKQVFHDGLLNPHEPGIQCVYHVINCLMLDVAEGCPFQVLHHMWRYTEDPADLLHAEFAGGKKLAVLRRKADRFVGHAFFEKCDLVSVIRTAICVHPVVTDLLRILQNTRMLQHTERLPVVFEEGTAVFLHGNGRAQRVLHHGDGRKSDKAVKPKARDMQDFIPPEDDVFIRFPRDFIRIGVVDVIQFSLLRPVDLHVFREKRIQAKDTVFTIPHYLRIGVAPQKQVCHDRFPK